MTISVSPWRHISLLLCASVPFFFVFCFGDEPHLVLFLEGLHWLCGVIPPSQYISILETLLMVVSIQFSLLPPSVNLKKVPVPWTVPCATHHGPWCIAQAVYVFVVYRFTADWDALTSNGNKHYLRCTQSLSALDSLQPQLQYGQE